MKALKLVLAMFAVVVALAACNKQEAAPAPEAAAPATEAPADAAPAAEAPADAAPAAEAPAEAPAPAAQ